MPRSAPECQRAGGVAMSGNGTPHPQRHTRSHNSHDSGQRQHHASRHPPPAADDERHTPRREQQREAHTER